MYDLPLSDAIISALNTDILLPVKCAERDNLGKLICCKTSCFRALCGALNTARSGSLQNGRLPLPGTARAQPSHCRFAAQPSSPAPQLPLDTTKLPAASCNRSQNEVQVDTMRQDALVQMLQFFSERGFLKGYPERGPGMAEDCCSVKEMDSGYSRLMENRNKGSDCFF